MSAFAKHVLDNWTPAMDKLMDSFDAHGKVLWEQLLNTVTNQQMSDKHCVANARQHGKELFRLLSMYPYSGSGEIILNKYKQLIPNWQTYLANYTGSDSTPQVKVVEKIVERRVEVPVEKIIYVDKQTAVAQNINSNVFDMAGFDEIIYEIHRFELSQSKPISNQEFIKQISLGNYPHILNLLRLGKQSNI